MGWPAVRKPWTVGPACRMPCGCGPTGYGGRGILRLCLRKMGLPVKIIAIQNIIILQKV